MLALSGFNQCGTRYTSATGCLQGKLVTESIRRIGDLQGVYGDEQTRAALPQDGLAYRVESHLAVKDGTPGGLFFGTSYLEPGLIGQEYRITKGHFHTRLDTAEYYWCIQGEGILLLMDEKRHTWGEVMTTGSLHYIPGRIAHRLANIGRTTLVVSACWPSDAGHDYESIARIGFSARLLQIGGKPELVEE